MKEESKQLAGYIKNLNDFKIVDYNMGSYNNIGATIIEGILQANVNYKSVVRPRIEKFIKEYSACKDLKSFQALIEKEGIENIINFRGEKCRRIISLVGFLLENGINTEKQFAEWLANGNNLVELKKLKGIGDKTTDYFKILVGIENVAIDIHIKRFLEKAGIFNKQYSEARQIVMGAAKLLNINPSLLDHSIWKYMSEAPKVGRKPKDKKPSTIKKASTSKLLRVYQFKNGQIAIRATDSRNKIISHKIAGKILSSSVSNERLGGEIRDVFKQCG